MKSYTEQNLKTLIDWNKVLEEAIAGNLNNFHFCKYVDMASGWVTCACGAQCDIIPRSIDGSPLDEELSDLGIEFYSNFRSADFVAAKKTLEMIEARSIQLINEINSQNNEKA